MNDPNECPECESWGTRLVHTEVTHDTIERVRACESCPTEYVVAYGNPILREVRNADDGGER